MIKNIYYFLVLALAVPKMSLAIENPLNSDYSTLPAFLTALIENVIIPVAIPIIVVMIIYAGFRFVTAGGNQTQLDEAKRMLLYALIGALIILGAFAIQTAVEGTIEDITDG